MTEAANKHEATKTSVGEVALKKDRLIGQNEVEHRTSLGRTAIWELERKGCFPRARSVGAKKVYVESEIDEFISTRPLRPIKGQK